MDLNFPFAGRTIAHYRILEKIGSGGMGIVYRALDINLGRDVAMKVLPERSLSDANARARFQKEALALARVNHPHIEAVYEFDTFDGLDFLVTEHVPGATLASRVRAGPLGEAEVRRIGSQIAGALAAAHERGVVHCDLKPGNVILTPEGNVKLLDFGLARILRPIAASGDATTQTLQVAGTPPYMAPEQLTGAAADPRIDIYAAGVLLFEIATGRLPFPDTRQAMLIDAILHRRPDPPRSLQPGISEALNRVILRCLEKQAASRYRSAKELGKDLEASAGTTLPAAWITRRRGLASLALGLVAVLLAVAWLVGGHPVFSFAPRDWILIADFDNQTGDPVFDRSLLTAFTVSLEQSRVVNVVPRSRIDETLERMRQAPGIRIDEALGQEIASREGIKAVVVPGISGVGADYRLSARIRETATGVDVKTRIVPAAGKHMILTALDRLASGVRKDLGESLVARITNTLPLQRVTTSNLDALKQFSQGIEKHKSGLFSEARMYYDQALKLDPQFTAARAAMGMLVFEQFDPKGGARLLQDSLTELDRVTVKERYGILAFHATAVERNPQKATEYTKALLALYPDDCAAHNNLGRWYSLQRRYAEAVPEFRQALRIDPNFVLASVNLTYATLFGLGDLDATIEAGSAQFGKNDRAPWLLANLGWAYLGKDRLTDAEAVFRRSAELFPKFVLNRYRLGMTHRFERRWDEAVQAFQDILAVDRNECYAHYEIAMTRDLMADAQGGRREFAAAQRCLEGQLPADAAHARTYMLAAVVYSHLGDSAAAAKASQKGLSLDPTLEFEAATAAAAAGQTEEAVSGLEKAVQHGFDNFVWMKVHPEFQRFASNARFATLLRRHLKGLASQ
jgi:tetratricopeptide (TPR) repeat protein